MTPTKKKRSTLHSTKITLFTTLLSITLFSSLSSLPHYTSAQSTNYLIPNPVSGGAVARTRTNLFILGGATSHNPSTPTDQFITLDLTTPWPATRPAWTALNPGPGNFIYPATFTSDQKRMLVFHLLQSNYVYEFQVNTGAWVQSTVAFLDMKWQGVNAITDPSTGLVYLAAGYTDGTRTLMDIYNPTAQTINNTKLPDLSGPAGTVRFEARWFYGNVWCTSRKSILYWGGYQPSGPFPTENVVTELTVGTMTWTTMKTTGNPPSRRADHCMAISEDGSRMVVFGGRVKNVPNNEVFTLNTATGAWTQGPLADSRMYPACTIVGDLLLVWGGTIPGDKVANGDMLIYNYMNSTWLNSYTPPASLRGLVPPKIPTTVTPGTASPTSPISPSSTASRPPVATIGSPSGTATKVGSEKETSNNLGAIVGGVVGALAVILAAVGFMFYRRKQQHGSTQKGVPLLSVKTANSDNNSTNNNHHNSDDEDEQDNAKKHAAGFGPVQSGRLMNKQILSRGSGGYAGSAAVVGIPNQDPQAIVQIGDSPMNMRMRDLELQQQQLDLKWQLLMLQQQEQQLRSPMQQYQYQQQQQQYQQQQQQYQQQQQQQQSQLQHEIHLLGGREARGSVVSVNTNTSSANSGLLGPYSRQEYDDFSSLHTSSAPTVHTYPETELWNRGYSKLWTEPTRIPNNPHTNVPH